MSLFRRERRSWIPEPPVPPFPGVSPSGMLSTPSSMSALQISAVWACVRLIAETVAMMPVSAYRWQGDVRVSMPAPSLLRQPTPDPQMPFSAFLYEIMVSYLLRGNWYARIVAGTPGGYPQTLQLLNPDEVTPVEAGEGLITYRYQSGTLPADQIVHGKAFQYPGKVTGLSPIQFAAQTIRTMGAVGEFALGYFSDAPHPSATLTTPAGVPVNDEQAATLKARFKAAVAGRDIAVLTQGTTYTPISVTPEESQFLATQKYGVAEICRIFGVPPEMVASDASSSMTYSNIEQRSLGFLTYTIQPWLTRIEDLFALLLPASQHLRFDTTVLTRTDLLTTTNALAAGINSRQITPDEARHMRDLEPLTPDDWAAFAQLAALNKPAPTPIALVKDPATDPGDATGGDDGTGS